jgi:hypothetical protein
MDDESLVEIYRAGDMASAAFLQHLLEERGLPVVQREAGMDGFMASHMGHLTYRIMLARSDVEAHLEAIAEAIREYEDQMGRHPEA